MRLSDFDRTCTPHQSPSSFREAAHYLFKRICTAAGISSEAGTNVPPPCFRHFRSQNSFAKPELDKARVCPWKQCLQKSCLHPGPDDQVGEMEMEMVIQVKRGSRAKRGKRSVPFGLPQGHSMR